MEVLKIFRHENKYRINKNEMYNIRDKLTNLLHVDRNINGYMVRSLYFDSINDIDYYDKLAGVASRKKIRLRTYMDDSNLLKLELKSKYDTNQLKESLIINRQIAEYLINGNYEVLLSLNNELASRIYMIMKSNCYYPKCIIEYDRIAFMSNSTTRITLDYNIKTTNDVTKFFSSNINYIEVINKNEAVLEVKYDLFLEPYIGDILNKFISNNESISKYIMGRNE